MQPLEPSALNVSQSGARSFSVSFFLVPGFSMMALSAAVEPLRSVNRLVGEQRYLWQIVSRDPGPVAASNGLEMRAAHGLADAPFSDLTVVVASLDVDAYHEPKLLQWLRNLRDGKRMIGAISNGSLILARAGVLDGSRATIHWETHRRLAEEFPKVCVCSDLYCMSSEIITAAGGTAAMDMMLALISSRDGRDVAADVADQFLHGPVRAATAMQRQDVHWRYQVTDRRLVTVIRLMEGRISKPMPIAKVAEFGGLSERQMERLFESALGKSPSRFYLDLRLKVALHWLLQSTETLEEIAAHCGFSSPGHFSRAFKACYALPPSAVRRRGHDGNVGTMQEIGDAT